MERQLNEQWILEINGVKHMVKAVEGICIDCFLENGSRCTRSGECPAGDQGDYIIKDLGILNEDGCLPAPWDETKYPKITVLFGNVYNIEVMKGYWFMQVRGDTKEKAVDRWNRRA